MALKGGDSLCQRDGLGAGLRGRCSALGATGTRWLILPSSDAYSLSAIINQQSREASERIGTKYSDTEPRYSRTSETSATVRVPPVISRSL